MEKCLYCGKELKEEGYFACVNCGDDMCDDCYEKSKYKETDFNEEDCEE